MTTTNTPPTTRIGSSTSIGPPQSEYGPARTLFHRSTRPAPAFRGGARGRAGGARSAAVAAIVADQRGGRGVLGRDRLLVAADRSRQSLGQLLAQLHAPLVEGVDAPHHALHRSEERRVGKEWSRGAARAA